MSRKRQRWIVIEHWDKYQHYKDRNPPWIKNHIDLLDNQAYLDLSLHRRAILHGLWLVYARSTRQLRDDTLTLTRRLGQRVTRADLESLNHAGFIRFSASNPLATCKHSRARSQEAEAEEEATPPLPPIVPPPDTAPPTADAAAPPPAAEARDEYEPATDEEKARAANMAAEILARLRGIGHLERSPDGVCDTPGCASDHRRWRLGQLDLCAECAGTRVEKAKL